MIKVNMGEVEIRGTKPVIEAEFSILVHTLVEMETFGRDDVKRLVENGFKSKEEMKKEVFLKMLDMIVMASRHDDDREEPDDSLDASDDSDEKQVCDMVNNLMRDIFGKE